MVDEKEWGGGRWRRRGVVGGGGEGGGGRGEGCLTHEKRTRKLENMRMNRRVGITKDGAHEVEGMKVKTRLYN